MPLLPSVAQEILLSFSVVFTEPTFRRILVLTVGAILTPGRRTVTSIVWTVRAVMRGHFSDYHRVFSRASWSLWPIGMILARWVLRHVPDDEPVVVALDDTTAQHRGKKVYGKGCHHDAVRSAHKHIVFKWGHKWIVFALTVKFPFASRPWALPVVVALYRPEELNRKEGRRHKTPPHLARQLMAVLLRWFPERKFIFLGDGGYASHELARFCSRFHPRATLVSRFRGDANLYAPPKPTRQVGRPRTKGKKLPAPQAVVAKSRIKRATVGWFGGQTRRVGLVTGTGHWYKGGHGLVPIRWVFVKDLQGTHRDEYFYTTDLGLTPVQIVTLYTRRWSIEVTFQEVRAHLGFESTRQRVAPSVLRMAPCLLGLFSLVSLIFAEHVRRHAAPIGVRPWYAKAEPTFSDAVATVRRLFWWETILKQGPKNTPVTKFPPKIRAMLLDHLSTGALTH